MFDWLVRIPGQQFLLIFPFFFVIVVLAVRGLYGIGDSKFDTTEMTPKLNALEFAVLCGGEKRAVELGLFELYREGCISFDDKNRIILKHPPEFMQADLLTLGKKLYDEASKRKYIHQLTNDSYSDSFQRNYIGPVFKKLQNLGLIGASEVSSRNLQIYWAGLLTWLAFGGIKLFYGIARSRPSGFLILELIIAFLLYKALVTPKVRQLTKLGRRALEETNQSLASKKQFFIDNGQISDTPSVLLMAAFGVAAFGQIPFVSPFISALEPVPTGIPGTNSSNRGGCGSCSAHWGGGSDGGGCGGGCGSGGCGGGGCGGCGGCGGD